MDKIVQYEKWVSAIEAVVPTLFNTVICHGNSLILHITNNTSSAVISVLDRLHDQLPHHNQVLVVKMCLGVFHPGTLQFKQKMQRSIPSGMYHTEMEIEEENEDVKKNEGDSNSFSEKYNSRKFSIDSTEKDKFGNDTLSPRKKKIPISETFYSRHSPQAIGRKVYCPSPLRGQNPAETSPFPSVGRVNRKLYTAAERPEKKMKIGKSRQAVRDVNSSVDQNLITKFRLIFLGVTKNDYMKQIHSGRLPR